MKTRIEDWNDDGRGRGRLDGRVALVSQALPGEELLVRVDRETRGTLQGRVRELLAASADRLEHVCGHEFTCTGCPLLAAPLAEEARFKEQRLRRLLTEALLEVPDIEPLRTPTAPFGYRHLAKGVFGRVGGRVVLGSYVTGTHEVVDNRGCPVLAPELAQLMDAVADAIVASGEPVHGDASEGGWRYALARQSRATGQQLLTLVTSRVDTVETAARAHALFDRHASLVGVTIFVNAGPGNVLLVGEPHLSVGPAAIEEELLGFRHEIGPRSFFQINPEAAAAVFRIALEMAGRGTRVLETHAGVGALTLPLATAFDTVLAVESEAEAARALARTAAGAGDRVGHVDVTCARIEDVLPGLLATGPETLVADPPRAGLGEGVVEAVVGSAVPRVVLASCSPEALARDLVGLTAGGFGVRRLVPVDQFPRTAHLETVTLLER